eukprot:11951988-Heterocapsa_arctica.AAC.1
METTGRLRIYPRVGAKKQPLSKQARHHQIVCVGLDEDAGVCSRCRRSTVSTRCPREIIWGTTRGPGPGNSGLVDSRHRPQLGRRTHVSGRSGA